MPVKPLPKAYTGQILASGARVCKPLQRWYTVDDEAGCGTVKITVGAFKKAPTPKITGTAKVGKKLTAKPGTWSPKPKLSYQWYAGGTKIKKATKSTFTLTSKQKNKKITVKVTAKKTGYKTVTKTSKATGKVT